MSDAKKPDFGKMPSLAPIPGFKDLEWEFVLPSGYEDGPAEPYYIKRFIRYNAFPDAPDGKTGAIDSIVVSLSDVRNNPPEAIANIIAARRDVAEASLRALFADRGVEFPS